MELVIRVGVLYQRKGPINETRDTKKVLDYRVDSDAKPFAISYFKIPEELPLDWQSSNETGTKGSVYQKDD